MPQKHKFLSFLALFVCVLVYAFVPSVIARSAAMLVSLFLLSSGINRGKPFSTFPLLIALYTLAFVYPGYWLLFPAWPLKILCLVVIIGTGVIWTRLASGQISSDGAQRYKSSWQLIALLVILAWSQYPGLKSDVAWRGDEDYHILTLLAIKHHFFNLAVRLIADNTFRMLAMALIALVLSAQILLNFAKSKENVRRWLMPAILMASLISTWPCGIRPIH